MKWFCGCNLVSHLEGLQLLVPQPEFLMYVWFLFSSQIWTMSHPSWLPPKSTNEPVGHVTARMETTHAFGTPSISVSTQQTPKKFAPVVAPKPKYNPYKQPGGDGEYVCGFFFVCLFHWCVVFFFRKDPQKSYSGILTSNTNCVWQTLGSWVCGIKSINKNVKEPCTLWQAVLLNGAGLGESRGTAVPLFLL